MFKFNFSVDTENKEDEGTMVSEPAIPERNWLPVQNHKVTQEHFKYLIDGCFVEEVTIGDTKLKYISMESALEKLEESEVSSNIAPAFEDHTDLVPAVYEGGLKIWECTWDLLDHLTSSEVSFKDCRVLELGCGAGLPGLYAACQGAHVTLQDYNEEVIRYVTMPNAVLNLVDSSTLVVSEEETIDCKFTDASCSEVTEKANFFSGDWGELERKLEKAEQKFDVILTSETIYNPECYEKLLQLMTKCLKSDGVIFMAAKAHYFGVGGGTQQFINLLKSKDLFDIKSVVSNAEGLKREILEIKFKNKVL